MYGSRTNKGVCGRAYGLAMNDGRLRQVLGTTRLLTNDTFALVKLQSFYQMGDGGL